MNQRIQGITTSYDFHLDVKDIDLPIDSLLSLLPFMETTCGYSIDLKKQQTNKSPLLSSYHNYFFMLPQLILSSFQKAHFHYTDRKSYSMTHGSHLNEKQELKTFT
jgi:hypothetical protein